MALTIIQQPQSLTFVGNIPDLIAQTDGLGMTVNVSKGATLILSEHYTADEGGKARVSLKDFLDDQLQLELPAPDTDLFEQTKSWASFSLEIISGESTETVEFVAIKGGSSTTNLDCPAYLLEAWLTWQPQIKKVKDIQPEWLSYFTQHAAVVKVRGYFSGGTYETVDLHDLEADKHYTINMTFSDLRTEFVEQPIYIDVWVENAPGGDPVFSTYRQRYMLTTEFFEFDDFFLFKNSVAGLDLIRFTGVKDTTNPIEVDSALYYDEYQRDYQVTPSLAFEKNTGFFRSRAELLWSLDFFQAKEKYFLIEDEFTEIRLINPEFTAPENTLASMDFKFSYTRQTVYLSLFKKKSPLIDPVIIGPGDDDYYLPPDIGEFPQQSDPSGLLFPVQKPGTPGWFFITWENMLAEIYDNLPAVVHNQTTGKQGGAPGEYYHLTAEQHEKVENLQDPEIQDGWITQGTAVFTTPTQLDVAGWTWNNGGEPQAGGTESIDPIEGTPTDYNRVDFLLGGSDDDYLYVSGTEDPDQLIDPEIPAGYIVLVRFLRQPNGTNTSTPGNGGGNSGGNYVSKSAGGTQMIKSEFGSEKWKSSFREAFYTDANGVARNIRVDYHGVYSTVEGVGATDWSKIVTIDVSGGQLRYFVMLEFAGVSPAMEKGMVWIQFETDGSGNLTVNKLKVFGEINPAKLKMVKLDANTFGVFVHHNESGAFFKFRPQFSFGGSTVYDYHHQNGRDALPAGTQYEFELHGDLTDILDAIATLESDLTDLESNLIAIEAEVDDHEERILALEEDTGGADENAVHYNGSDGKSASEKQQARDNIGSDSGLFTEYTFGSNNQANIARPTNFLSITFTGVRNITGFSEGVNGESLCLYIASGSGSLTPLSISDSNNQIVTPQGTSFSLNQGNHYFLRYSTTLMKWVVLFDFLNAYEVQTVTGRFNFSMTGSISPITTPRIVVGSNIAGSYNAVSIQGAYSNLVGRAALRINNQNAWDNRQMIEVGNDNGINFRVYSGGGVENARSAASNQSIRRDEQFLMYKTTVATAGAIEDQVSTLGVFNYRFTAATSLGGMDGVEPGRLLLIQNDSAGDLTILDESASSIAANRFSLEDDLVLASKGKALFIYSDDTSRWELVTEGGSGGGGGGGADTNAVHYNADDSKTASEKTQARANIGSKAMPPQIVSSAGQIDNLAKTSNFISFTGGGDKTITGIANFDPGSGEEVVLYVATGTLTILGENGGSDAANRFQFQSGGTKLGSYSFITIKRGSPAGSAERWQVESLNRYVPEYGTYRKYNTLYIRGEGGASVLILETAAGAQAFKFDQGGLTMNASLVVTSNNIQFKPTSAGATIAFFKNSAGSDMIQVRSDRLLCNYTVEHSRSNSSVKSIRRDEQRIYYLTSVTTSGSIADQALTDGIFNYRFTAATDISGFGNGEIGRTIDIDNDSGSNLTLLHENAGSIAANRIYLIGTADLVIPTKGKVTLKYCTGSRWELVSKNF